MVQADGLLGGGIKVPSESLRGACWLARTALEDVVADYLLVVGYDGRRGVDGREVGVPGVSDLATAPEVSTAARFAWLGLSQASHHHAYELAPTVSEVKHLLGLVTAVVVAAEARKNVG